MTYKITAILRRYRRGYFHLLQSAAFCSTQKAVFHAQTSAYVERYVAVGGLCDTLTLAKIR